MTEQIRQVIDNHRVQQGHIRDKVLAAVKQSFPIRANKFTLRATNFKIKPRSFGYGDEKKVILSLGSTSEPLTANLELIENKTGGVVDRVTDFRLLNVPVMTGMHTFPCE